MVCWEKKPPKTSFLVSVLTHSFKPGDTFIESCLTYTSSHVSLQLKVLSAQKDTSGFK